MRYMREFLVGVMLVGGVINVGWTEDPFAKSKPDGVTADVLLPTVSADTLAAAQAMAARALEASAAAPTDAPKLLKAGERVEQLVGGQAWLRAAAAFVFVATTVLLGARLMKRYLVRAGVTTATTKLPLQVVQVLPVDRHARLAVVQFGDDQLLLGMTPQHVTVLHAQRADAAGLSARPPVSVDAAQERDEIVKAYAAANGEAIGGSDRGAPAGDANQAHAAPHGDLLQQVRGTIQALKPLSWKGKRHFSA